MRIAGIAAVVVMSFAIGPVAQSTSTAQFGIWPEAADSTSRSGLPGPSQGDVLIEVRGLSHEAPFGTGADFAGVGDVGVGAGPIHGFGVIFQDQDPSTTEMFDFVVVSEDPNTARRPAAPPLGNANGPEVLFRSSVLTTPPSSCFGGCFIHATFATPAVVLPERGSFYYGCGISANRVWTSDGLSINMASFDGVGPPAPNTGDNPRDGQASLAWARDVTKGTILQASPARTHAVFMLLETPVLNPGADIAPGAQVGPNPNFGAAGLYPDSVGGGNTGRVSAYGPSATPPGNYLGRAGVGDGLAFRVAIPRVQGVVVSQVLYSTGFAPPVAIPGFGGRLYLDANALGVVPGAQSSGTAGTVVISVLPPGGLTAGAVGVRVYWQALVWDQHVGEISFTNGTSTLF